LGTESFITAIRESLFSGKGNNEVPQWRELAPDYQRIKRAVCEFYDIGQAQLLHSRRGVINEPRNVAIYLARRLRGDSLKGIGREFHITKYSSVSSVIQRMQALISTDRRLKQRIEELAELSKSQKQT
jgi:chromosomal replication initiation ATPase DnaA